MVSPLKKTRENKIKILKEMAAIIVALLIYPKGSLDRMDMRKMKKVLNNLKDLAERGKPI